MARFNKSQADSNSAKVAPVTTEDAMEEMDAFDGDDFDTPEVETVEADETDAVSDAPTEAEPDITGFVSLVDGLVTRDEAGDAQVTDDDGIKSVREAYQALSRKEKNLAKKTLNEKMEAAVMADDSDITLARFYLDVQNRMAEVAKAAKGAGAAPKVVDPSEAVVKLIAKLDLARALVVIPEGMNEEDIRARAAALFDKGAEDVKNDEPELVWVKQAKNLAAAGKAGKVTSGTRTRHSVAAHIAEAFAHAEPGDTLTVNEIVAFKSNEYGEDRPTKQAVVLHLQSKKFQAATTVTVSETADGETVLVKK